MRPAELIRSTSFRLVILLTMVFLVAYLVAGAFAYRVVNRDLDERVMQSVELTAARLHDVYELEGKDALIAAVEARARSFDPEDDFIWLGDLSGARIAGQQLSLARELKTGDAMGAAFGGEEDDLYHLVVREFGDDMRLITGRSYEETDDIRDAVLGAYAWATVLILSLAIAAGVVLARRSQRRLAAITTTLEAVSTGRLSSRIVVGASGDDIDSMADGVNKALVRLEQTVETIRQVSTDIAHDLRTPINRLGIILETARDHTGDRALVEAKLDEADLEIRRISQSFDALLRISQIEAGARKARFKSVALREILETLHEAYLPVAEEHDQKLIAQFSSDDEDTIFGDRDLLTQLFANLIENALNHCPPGSTIAIDIAHQPTGVIASVSDNGPGIPEAERGNVVKRFYRLDKSRTTKGAGLGLSLVKAIADLHEARLTLVDNAPGLRAEVLFSNEKR